jgi:hypothetical protein
MGDRKVADQGEHRRAAGWKKDPTGRHFGRYWDGDGWTEHVVSAEKVTSVDPMEAPIFDESPPPPAPPEPAAPAAPVAPALRGPMPTTPNYVPPVRKPSKDGGVKVWKIALGVTLGLFLFMGVCIAVIGAGANKAAKDLATQSTTGESTAQPSGTSPAGTAPATKTSYKVGETARTGDFEVTLYTFTDPQPMTNQFDKAKAGNHYLAADVQIANKGPKALTFSSIVGFHVVDAANRQYDIAFTSLKPGAPEGQIPAGEALRGLAVFEVPDGTTGLRLRVQGSLTASGAFFALN